MNSGIKEFEQLLCRAGLSKDLIKSVFHDKQMKLYGYHSVFSLYYTAVHACCFLNRTDVLRDLTIYVNAHKRSNGKVNVAGVELNIHNNFPIDIVLRLVKNLFHKGMLFLLPSFIHAIIDVSVIKNSLSELMRQVTRLSSEDEQLVTNGYEALFETTQILLNVGDQAGQEIWDSLLALIKSSECWTKNGISQVDVKFVERHFRFVARLVDLFNLKNRVCDSPDYIFILLSLAEYQILWSEVTKRASDHPAANVYRIKINAMINGISDVVSQVLRNLLLSNLHASSLALCMDESQDCPHSDTLESSFLSILVHSHPAGRSRKLIELLLDNVSSSYVNKLKKRLISQIQNTPKISTDDTDSLSSQINALLCFKISAVEYLNEVELPHSLQHLARQAIHRKLWDGELHGAIQRESLSALGLPEIITNYCMYL